uniref:Uncharacterized protein n=1 Tax=Vespula pensylvanica TaxID=30213 RepID=A0A834P5H4_VESPE|nr:hypothetical protein H0235_007340 [Vespula pensylvanica]
MQEAKLGTRSLRKSSCGRREMVVEEDGIKETVEEAGKETKKASLFTNNKVATVQSKTKGGAFSADSVKTLLPSL